MPRPSQADQRREDFLPRVAAVFAELGYHRATTAHLAEACDTRENVLYRLWPDKEEMFIAAIVHVFQASDGSNNSDWCRMLMAGVVETDSDQIRDTLRGQLQQRRAAVSGTRKSNFWDWNAWSVWKHLAEEVELDQWGQDHFAKLRRRMTK